jgi:predicted porin
VQNTLFQTLMIGQANSHATATSASNGISYESPRMSGFGVKVQAFFGENTSPVANANLMTGKSGDGTSYHASYANGPITAGFGAQTTKGTNIAANISPATGTAQIPGKYDVSTAYATYNFGVARVALAQVTEEMALSTGANENKSTVLGLRVPMGAITLNANYTTSKYTVAGALAGKATQMGLQALYAMSKRTDLYINYAVTDNDTAGTGPTSAGKIYGLGNGAGRLVAVGAVGGNSTAYQIGMRHNF